MWQASERFFQCWLSSRLKVCEGTHLERSVQLEKCDENTFQLGQLQKYTSNIHLKLGREKKLPAGHDLYFIDKVQTSWAKLQKKVTRRVTSWGQLRSWRSWWGHASMLGRSSNLSKFCTNTNLSLILVFVFCVVWAAWVGALCELHWWCWFVESIQSENWKSALPTWL